jgi:hypothetical protein
LKSSIICLLLSCSLAQEGGEQPPVPTPIEATIAEEESEAAAVTVP